MAVQVLDLVAEAAGGDPLPLMPPPGLPSRSWARTVTFMGRLTMPYRPDRLRQPQKPSCSPFLADDFGVHQLQKRLVVIHHDDHPAEDTHLGGSQAQTLSVFQGVHKVLDEHRQLPVKIGNGMADLMECRVFLL